MRFWVVALPVGAEVYRGCRYGLGIFGVVDFVFHDSTLFHAPTRKFNPQPDGGKSTISRLPKRLLAMSSGWMAGHRPTRDQ
jgi:hypothetical protein